MNELPTAAAELSESERQILIVNRLLELRPRDRKTGQLIEPTREALCTRGREFFAEEFRDWTSSFTDLVAKGLLQKDGPLYALTESGRRIADQARAENADQRFSDLLTRSERSKAHSLFCRRVYGEDLCQLNLVDVQQLSVLLQSLSLTPGNRVLDLGCGMGRVSEYISDVTGATVTGIDIAGAAVAAASKRTLEKSERLRFLRMDMNDLAFPPGSVDTIISVDTLYFVDDLEETFNHLRSILGWNGRMGIFYSAVRWYPDDPEAIIQPDQTKVAKALQKNGFRHTVIDFSANEFDLWRRQRQVAEELKEAFAEEGNSDLCDSRLQEANTMLQLLEAGRGRRYLYCAVPDALGQMAVWHATVIDDQTGSGAK